MPQALPPESFDPLNDEDDERENRPGFVPDVVRRVAVAGLGALFMTEESIRSLASQLKLPKEVMGYILSQAEKTKDEVGRVLSEELRRFFQSEKLREEFLKLLSRMTVEVTAQVRLVPDAGKSERAAEHKQHKVTISDVNVRPGKRTKRD
jgi:hypothetical protein